MSLAGPLQARAHALQLTRLPGIVLREEIRKVFVDASFGEFAGDQFEGMHNGQKHLRMSKAPPKNVHGAYGAGGRAAALLATQGFLSRELAHLMTISSDDWHWRRPEVQPRRPEPRDERVPAHARTRFDRQKK